VDEVGTPDSSRFWPADAYRPGGPQPSFDKQYVRDWLDASGWDREPPPPSLPTDVVAGTSTRYVEAYERVAGEPFDAYRTRHGVRTADDEDALAWLREAHR
jgi:phosphoribosylaminoimidazole-succinocarboxamide synthase